MTKVDTDAYAQWVSEWIARGFDPHLITFMFRPLPGSDTAIIDEMFRQVELAYRLYLTRTVRRPLAPCNRDYLPIWIVAPDLPVFKHNKQSLRDVSVNRGLHVQGIALEPHLRRSREELMIHVARYTGSYRARCPSIQRIHVEPIIDDLPRVTRYILKTVKRGLDGIDDFLVLPRTVGEVR